MMWLIAIIAEVVVAPVLLARKLRHDAVKERLIFGTGRASDEELVTLKFLESVLEKGHPLLRLVGYEDTTPLERKIARVFTRAIHKLSGYRAFEMFVATQIHAQRNPVPRQVVFYLPERTSHAQLQTSRHSYRDGDPSR